jgi:hypothetical protein
VTSNSLLVQTINYQKSQKKKLKENPKAICAQGVCFRSQLNDKGGDILLLGHACPTV